MGLLTRAGIFHHTNSPDMYQYKALITEVYDGDTCTAVVDLGFTVSVKVKFRLLGINTPELKGGTPTSKALGIQARDYLRGLILGKEVTLTSVKGSDSFGRWLCSLTVVKENILLNVNEEMIRAGFSLPVTEWP